MQLNVYVNPMMLCQVVGVSPDERQVIGEPGKTKVQQLAGRAIDGQKSVLNHRRRCYLHWQVLSALIQPKARRKAGFLA